MKRQTTHEEQLEFLKKIEGQVRGIQKMITEGRYCVDILTQLHSIVGAILKVEDTIFRKHVAGCVTKAFQRESKIEKLKKIDEVVALIHRFRKI